MEVIDVALTLVHRVPWPYYATNCEESLIRFYSTLASQRSVFGKCLSPSLPVDEGHATIPLKRSSRILNHLQRQATTPRSLETYFPHKYSVETAHSTISSREHPTNFLTNMGVYDNIALTLTHDQKIAAANFWAASSIRCGSAELRKSTGVWHV